MATKNTIRLNKFIANSGLCSRREADMHIGLGTVKVNGKIVTEMGYQVQPGDEVKFDGQRINADKPTYVLLNKPKGFLASVKKGNYKKDVLELIARAAPFRIDPLHAMDRSTTGLLLFTNDKGLAKIEIALCRGKKQFDKRESIKDRDNKRDLSRLKKSFNKYG